MEEEPCKHIVMHKEQQRQHTKSQIVVQHQFFSVVSYYERCFSGKTGVRGEVCVCVCRGGGGALQTRSNTERTTTRAD